MSVSTQTSRAQAALASTPVIYNVTAPGVAGTEFSRTLSADTKRFMIRSRTRATLQLAFVSGDTNITFITIPPGTTFHEDGLNLGGVTIYLESDTIGNVVEILEWS